LTSRREAVAARGHLEAARTVNKRLASDYHGARLAAAQFENQFLVDLFLSTANMCDGHPVVHNSHGNLAGAGAVISETSLTAGRLAMRQQSEPGGQLIDATPRFLIVPSALETLAEKTITAIQARAVADVTMCLRS
jgi:hypothetical protein